MAYVDSEDTSEFPRTGQVPVGHASIVSIANASQPILLSTLPLPQPPSGSSYRDFTEKGGRTGPHNSNLLHHNLTVRRQGNLFYIAYFNAGLRVYNVANPHLTIEVGYFIPPDPTTRYGALPTGRLVAQTEDVLVDRRGYIYITDKNQGVWILRYIGEILN